MSANTFGYRVGSGWWCKSKSGKWYLRIRIGDLVTEDKFKDFLGKELVLSIWPSKRGKKSVNVFVDVDYMRWKKRQEWAESEGNDQDAPDFPF